MASVSVLPISEKSFTFKVPKISALTTTWSPVVVVQDTPWKIQISKRTFNGKQWLALHLHCGKKDEELNWSHAASATFKLLPFDNKPDAIKRDLKPFYFTSNRRGTGYSDFFSWTDLFDKRKCYVKDDTITLKIKITAEDANMINRSQLKIESIDKCCENGCVVNIRLIVMNIKNLMAVKSSKIDLRNIPWNLTVFNDFSKLGLCLESYKLLDDVSCKIKMTVNLVSQKHDVNAIEKIYEQSDPLFAYRYINGICLWDELFKPENGFVNNDSIELQVKIEAEKLKGNIPDDIQGGAKQPRMECAICLESMKMQNASVTSCGHLFCTECITLVLRRTAVCPVCGVQTSLNDLRRTYLPITN